jgi:hypothetical protein
MTFGTVIPPPLQSPFQQVQQIPAAEIRRLYPLARLPFLEVDIQLEEGGTCPVLKRLYTKNLVYVIKYR